MRDEKRKQVQRFFRLTSSPCLNHSSFIIHPFLFGPISFNFVQQFVYSFALFFDSIAHEMNLRSARQVKRESKLFADVRRGVIQSAQSQAVFLFISGNGEIHARRFKIF